MEEKEEERQNGMEPRAVVHCKRSHSYLRDVESLHLHNSQFRVWVAHVLSGFAIPSGLYSPLDAPCQCNIQISWSQPEGNPNEEASCWATPAI